MPFWIDPCILFGSTDILPTPEMDSDEKLNTISRLSFIISIVLYIMLGPSQAVQFIVLALAIILVLYFASRGKSKEGFSIAPTYTSDDFIQTTVAPVYAEEWHNPAEEYNIVVDTPVEDIFETPLNPQMYPYGQYLTKTNLLPSDEFALSTGSGSLESAKEFANNAWQRNDMAYRENMMRITKKKMMRRRRHNCRDTFSPFSSY